MSGTGGKEENGADERRFNWLFWCRVVGAPGEEVGVWVFLMPHQRSTRGWVATTWLLYLHEPSLSFWKHFFFFASFPHTTTSTDRQQTTSKMVSSDSNKGNIKALKPTVLALLSVRI